MTLILTGKKQMQKDIKAKQKKLKNYRIVFINQMKRSLERIAKFIIAEGKFIAREFQDTGTLGKRIDFKVHAYNHMEIGIYEDSAHPPTVNISKYTGKVRNPEKEYAQIVHSGHKTHAMFLQNLFDKVAVDMVHDEMNRLYKEYFEKG